MSENSYPENWHELTYQLKQEGVKPRYGKKGKLSRSKPCCV
jgi:hypothetical protein